MTFRCPNKAMFQSAPHFSSEANRAWDRSKIVLETFQSAPHFSSEANVFTALEHGGQYKFQSAPHFSSEANACVSISGIRSRICFNPRLTSAARRTLVSRSLASARGSVSIRASLQQRGEHFPFLD